MSRRFFDLKIDVYVPGRWYLAEPQDRSGREFEDIWSFTHGNPVRLHERLHIPIYKPGKPLDFDFAGVGLTPIINERTAFIFRELAPLDIQLFPVDVQDQPEPYYLMNVARQFQCIDDAACREARRWKPEDGKPDRVGQYHVVSGLRIDKSKIGEARVFRLWGYFPPIIVDGDLKDALERASITGARFDEV